MTIQNFEDLLKEKGLNAADLSRLPNWFFLGLFRDDTEKIAFLHNFEIIQKYNIDEEKLMQVILSLSDENIKKLLCKVEPLQEILNKENIKRLIIGRIQEENEKLVMLGLYGLEDRQGTQILGETSDFVREIDLNGNLEMYRGVDKQIGINAIRVPEEDRPKLHELCEICPNMSIFCNISFCPSTGEEYIIGEKWIDSVLDRLNPEWSSIQKVAFIDHAIGNKVSYSPDFDTEVFDESNSRALWKIITSGYGVCDGIAQVEEYMLKRIGIDVERVSSDSHSFLKLKNIEIPTESGDIIQGDTILDPTWNLTSHRFGSKPENFCRSYSKIREHDIREDGTDTESHKNDEELASATLDLDEQSLRRIFTSIGLADKEGNFPIGDLMDKSMMIDAENFPEEESIKRQFSLLAEYCPEFATCQNSTMSILQGVLLNHENLNFNKCVVNRVYAREDEDKRPRMYVYVDFPNAGKKFYIAEKEAFVELSQMEFEAKFECYEMDMEKQDGRRPWEVPNRTQKVEDLTRSSGKIIAEEGDGR